MKKKSEELQVYSGIAILFVVILHSNAYYLMNVLKLGSYLSAGLLIYIVDKIVHAAVPMFIFAAGYKYAMNNSDEAYKDYFLKKYNSIFKPFLYVSTFYLLYRWINVMVRRLNLYHTVDIGFILNGVVKGFFSMFVGYNFAYQLWYIPMYLFIILSYPIIAKHLKNAYIRLTVFIALAVFWEVISNLGIPRIANYPYPLLFVYYFFLYEMGSLFYVKKLYQKKPGIIILLYFALLLSTVVIKNTLFVRILSDLVLNPVSAVFFYYVAVKLKDNKILTVLGNWSFYIYLFHEPLILSTTARYLLNHNLYRWGWIAPALAVMSVTVITVFCSVFMKPQIRKYNKDTSASSG